MNTQFWGPPGWELLHILTFNYPKKPTEKQKTEWELFFKSIGFVLPCKYCRESYKFFLKENDTLFKNFWDKRESVIKWLYLIHNKVNNKLKNQKDDKGNPLLVGKNPSLKEVTNIYTNFIKESSWIDMPGWDFIHSIAFNYEPTEERKKWYPIFFNILFNIVPCRFDNCLQVFKNVLERFPIEASLKSQESMICWVYSMHKKFSMYTNRKFQSFPIFFERIEQHRSGCEKNKKISTKNEGKIKNTCRIKGKREPPVCLLRCDIDGQFINPRLNGFNIFTSFISDI